MSHVHEGPLATYNSLTDTHLAGYFANNRMRRHLRKSGLVSKRGEIVSESTYRLNMSRREHKKHVKDMLAQAIVHKSLDMERSRQAEIKKKLEEIAKIQLVRRVRDDRAKKYEEALLPLLSPRCNRTRTPSLRHLRSHRTSKSQSTSSVSGSKRNKSDRASTSRKGDEDILPILTPRSSSQSPRSSPRGRGRRSAKPHSNGVPGVLYLDDEGRPITPALGSDRRHPEQGNIDTRHLHSLDTAALRKYALLMAQMEEGRGLNSPYMMPQVPMPPRPPSSSRSPRSARRVQSASPRRIITTDSRLARLHRPETAKSHAGDQQTLCRVAMRYHGWALQLARERVDLPGQEVVIEQQHCGGNTLTVFKERLEPGSKFEFISYRHRGYPFSLSLYVDGQMDSRVSTCCEYRHSRGAKIGGKQGHFSLLRVSGAVPCYKCQVVKGVRVPGQASPKRMKRPAEVRREEVIVVSTKADDGGNDRHRRQEKSKPAEDDYEDDVVMIPVERTEHESGSERDEADSKPVTNAQSDDYADDFEDSQASHSSKYSSPSYSSESESETEPATPKEEEYTLSIQNKERGQEQPPGDIIPRDGATPLSFRSRGGRPRPKSAPKGRLSERADSDGQSPERAPFPNTVTPIHSPTSSARSSSSSVSVAQQGKPKRKKKARAGLSEKKPDSPPLETAHTEAVKHENGGEEEAEDQEEEHPPEKPERGSQTPRAASEDKAEPDTPAPARVETAEEVATPAEPDTPEPCDAVAEQELEPEPAVHAVAEEKPESTNHKPQAEKGTTSSSVVAEATKRPDVPVEDKQKAPLNKDQQVFREGHNGKTSEEADTADEVSDIESEVVSPRRLDPHPPLDLGRVISLQSGDSPRTTLSPRHQGHPTVNHLVGVSEEEEEQRMMKEEEEDKEEDVSRGEEDVKNAYNTLNEEPRGCEEEEGGNYIILSSHHGSSRRKGVWNDSHSKAHSSLPPQPRLRTTRKQSSSTNSTSTATSTSTTTTTTTTEDDSYASSNSTVTGSEHYSTVAQKDERAALGEEQEGDKRYTLHQPKKEKIIKRSKKKQTKHTAKSEGRRKKESVESLPYAVEPVPFDIPPSDHDASRGKEQSESVEDPGLTDLPHAVMISIQEEGKNTGSDRGDQVETAVAGTGQTASPEEPVSQDPHPPQSLTNHLESGLHADDTFDNSEKQEEEPVPVDRMPAIVISPVSEGQEGFRTTSTKEQYSASDDSSSQSSSSSSEKSESDRIQHISGEKVLKNGNDNTGRLNSSQDKPDGDFYRSDADHPRQHTEQQEARIALVLSEAPDSPRSKDSPTPDLSISSVRRMSAEQGTSVEKVVLAQLRRSSVELEDAIRPRQLSPESDSFQSPRQRRFSGDDGVNLERRRSSLSVPLDAGSLQLADRWVTEQDLSRPHRGTEEDENVFWQNAQDDRHDAVSTQTKTTDQTSPQRADNDASVSIDVGNSPRNSLHEAKVLPRQDQAEAKSDQMAETASSSCAEMGRGKEDVEMVDINVVDAFMSTGEDTVKEVIETHVTGRQIPNTTNEDTAQTHVTSPSPKTSPQDLNNDTSGAEIPTSSPEPSPEDEQKTRQQNNEVTSSSSSLSSSDSPTLTNSDSTKSSSPETKVTTKSDHSEDLGGKSHSDLSSPLPATPEEMARKQETMRAGQSTPLPQSPVLPDEELEALKQQVERDVSRPQEPSSNINVALPTADHGDLYVIHESENEASDVDRSGTYRKEDFRLHPANTVQQSVTAGTEQTVDSAADMDTENNRSLDMKPAVAEAEPEEAAQTKMAADDAEGTRTPTLTPPTILITNPDTHDSRSSEDKSARRLHEEN